MSNNETKYTKRFLARIVLEATTPLALGSGEKNAMTDAAVAKDIYGLPFIPGTSIAGVLRHILGDGKAKSFFGFQEKNGGKGSEIMFTEARMVGENGEIIDGMTRFNANDSEFYSQYLSLPIRQHVRIGASGSTENHGKFDEEVVFKGTRFVFEIEQVGEMDDDGANFNEVLALIHSANFMLGSGTRCGFGQMRVVEMKTAVLDLRNEAELNAYLEKSSSLNASTLWSGWKSYTPENSASDGWTEYELELTPDDFFLFSSGFQDADADMTPVTEKVVTWNTSGAPSFSEDQTLIPATSVKGALSHRTAFHYNKKCGNSADKVEPKKVTGSNNLAVRTLFGSEDAENPLRGNVIIGDIIKPATGTHLMNHVSIDRFTGGAMGGALFTERATYDKGNTYHFTVRVANIQAAEHVMEAFENALTDLCRGMLPLGGGVNRGNGCFTGTLKKNQEIIYPVNQ